MGQRTFLMEMDAPYPSALLRAVSLSNRCDVIVERWENLTGRKAGRIAAVEEAAHAEG